MMRGVEVDRSISSRERWSRSAVGLFSEIQTGDGDVESWQDGVKSIFWLSEEAGAAAVPNLTCGRTALEILEPMAEETKLHLHYGGGQILTFC